MLPPPLVEEMERLVWRYGLGDVTDALRLAEARAHQHDQPEE